MAYKVSKNQFKDDGNGNITISDSICEEITEYVQDEDLEEAFGEFLHRHLNNNKVTTQTPTTCLSHDFLEAVKNSPSLKERVMDMCRDMVYDSEHFVGMILENTQSGYFNAHYKNNAVLKQARSAAVKMATTEIGCFAISKDKLQYDASGNVYIPDEICRIIFSHRQYLYAEEDFSQYIAGLSKKGKVSKDSPTFKPEFIEVVLNDPYVRFCLMLDYHDIKRDYNRMFQLAFKFCQEDYFKMFNGKKEHAPNDSED